MFFQKVIEIDDCEIIIEVSDSILVEVYPCIDDLDQTKAKCFLRDPLGEEHFDKDNEFDDGFWVFMFLSDRNEIPPEGNYLLTIRWGDTEVVETFDLQYQDKYAEGES